MPLRIIRRKDTGALTVAGTVRFPDGSWQRIRTRAQSDDLQLAHEEAAALEAQLLRDAWHGKRRGTRAFGEAVVSYLESEPRSAGTKRRLHRLLRAIGDVPLGAINQETIISVRQAMQITTPATIKRGVITPLRAVMLHAHRLSWCEAPHFVIPREPQGRTRYFLPSEAERLLAATVPHIGVLLITLLGTGLRMGEALDLDWREVDLSGGRAILWADQTKARQRHDVALPPRVVATLANLPYREGKVIRRDDGLPYADRRREGGGQIKTAWRATLRRAGLDSAFTPHDCRHTWASWHYAVHKDLLALRVAGGWSSVTQVERYAHLLPAGHETAIGSFWGFPWHVPDTDRANSPITN